MSAGLLTSSAFASVDCRWPFASNSSFYLTEKLTSDDQREYTLHVSSSSNDVSENVPYFAPGCTKDQTAFYDLYDGTIKENGKKYNFIVDIGTPEGKADQERIAVAPTCQTGAGFSVKMGLETIQVKGEDVLVSVQVFADDAAGSLMAYVRKMDLGLNSLVLTSKDGQAIASATKSFVTDPFKHAYWSVQNSEGVDR